MPGYGAGIDIAVYEAAGKRKLLAKRYEIGVIERGTSVITDGFDLPAKYIIHTVGTAWQGGNAGEEGIIRNCYRSVFRVAVEHGISSLAIPLLASGSYGFPKGIALRIALSEIESFLSGADMDVYLVVFDEKSVSLSAELYGDIDEYISDHYVEEKNQKEYWDVYASDESPGLAPGAFDRRSVSLVGSSFISRKGKRADRGKRKGSAKKLLSSDECRMASLPEEEELLSADECLSVSLPEEEDAEELLSADACLMAPAEEERDAEGLFSSNECLMAPPAKERSLDEVVKNLDKTFMELVFSFADAKGLTDVQVQKKANLDRKAFSKLKCGTTKNPSKSTALALAIALELDLDDTKDLLSRAGLALSPCSKQDVIVRYFIEKKAYDIYEINVALFEHGEQLLGTQSA